MKTRYLADSLGLPANWQAERYSTTIALIRDRKPGEADALRVTFPAFPEQDLTAIQTKCSEIVAANP